VLLILFGAGLLLTASFDSVASSISYDKYAQRGVAEVKVEKIYIPALKRTLNVSDGFVTGNRWTVSGTGVSHLTSSALPGNPGNAILYGHNRDGILAKLWQVQKGDFIYVTLSDSSISKYIIFERKEIEPDGVEILDDVGDSRLTLYTCSGFLDSARYVVVGKLI